MFSRGMNLVVLAGSIIGTFATLTYLLRYEEAALAAELPTALGLPGSLGFTALFLAVGTATIAKAQPEFVHLCQTLVTTPLRLPLGHAASVAVGSAVTLPFVLIAMPGIAEHEVFPQPDAVAAGCFLLIAIPVVLLCWHGIYAGSCFLLFAYQRSHETHHALSMYTNRSEQRAFERTHTYTAWSFSVAGALQLPILLALRPGLPPASGAVALAFTVALVVMGPLIFWLPRHWLRVRLEEEANELVAEVAAGGQLARLELLPAYEFLIAHLKSRGLALSIPALVMAAGLRLQEMLDLAETVGINV